MAMGNPSAWTARFCTLDERFLERIIALWPRCLAVLPNNPKEDTITENLVAVLSKDAQARRLFHHMEYHYESFGYTPKGLAFSKGEIDMAVLLDQDRDRYLAYECKRLNVPRKNGVRSLATEYVQCGVRRFVTEKYAADLPIGCMLGYVLDGNTATACTKVLAALATPKNNAALVGMPNPEKPIGSLQRLSSRHVRTPSGQEIEVRHALLPF